MKHSRVTQADIARRAKVTQTTVSLAMRRHPSISQATRERIASLAKKMGYVPDPMLASLVAYRRAQRPASFKGVLGWVTNYPTERGWWNGQQIGYFKGATQQAQELGYKLETVWLREPGLKRDRIKQILFARGIQGLLMAPQPKPHTKVDLAWADFSAVAFGHTLQQPQLHVVMNHQFRNMVNLIRKLHALGLHRVGLAMPSSQDERAEHSYLAGYLVEQIKCARPDRLPYLLTEKFEQREFTAWFQEHRPRAIVTDLRTAPQIQSWLQLLGCRVPGDIALVLPNVPFGDSFYTGIDENPLLVGATAVNAAVGMIHRGERGAPENPRSILIEGSWFPGKSLRP
jgi:LacI family transcriptional regulator